MTLRTTLCLLLAGTLLAIIFTVPGHWNAPGGSAHFTGRWRRWPTATTALPVTHTVYALPFVEESTSGLSNPFAMRDLRGRLGGRVIARCADGRHRHRSG